MATSPAPTAGWIDVLVVGRATWEIVQGFTAWPWADKRLIVLTHRALEAAHGEETHSGRLAPLAARLASEGARRVYLDGGVAIRCGLDEDLVDDGRAPPPGGLRRFTVSRAGWYRCAGSARDEVMERSRPPARHVGVEAVAYRRPASARSRHRAFQAACR